MSETILPEKVVLVLSSELGPGTAANVTACLAAGLAAGLPGWAGRPLSDASGISSVASSHLPIAILAADASRMAELALKLAQPRAQGCIALFPAYAQSIHDAQAYWKHHQSSSHTNEVLFGVGFAGPKRWVNSLTGSLPLLR